MRHRVAVRTNGTQVGNGVYAVTFANRGWRHEVVNMNVTGPNVPVSFFEFKTANETRRTIVPNARVARLPISFVTVDMHLTNAAFRELSPEI